MKKVLKDFLSKHKSWLCLLLVSTSLIFTSCEDQRSSVLEEISGENIKMSDLSLIQAMGFDTTDIIEMDSYYAVEGDIMLSKELLRNNSGSAYGIQTKQRMYTSLVSNANVKNMTVCINNDVSSTWRAAVISAINTWNNIPRCDVHFEYTTSTNADIRVKTGNPGSAIAEASWPANGKPGPSIQISSTYEHYTSSQKLFVMTHELGHCIGLAHTNVNQFDLIPGTPITDSSSIMNAETGGTSWSGFSNYDTYAINKLYPPAYALAYMYVPAMSPMDIGREFNLSVNSRMSGTVTYEWDTVPSIGSTTIISGQGTSTVRLRINRVPFQIEVNFRSSTGEFGTLHYYDVVGGYVVYPLGTLPY